ncbi:hypothetical protein TNCV_2603351 [Trichonephila clavipes]|nr:hypothetical protein TNCV_2603351 [Trichonephila clavipes]
MPVRALETFTFNQPESILSALSKVKITDKINPRLPDPIVATNSLCATPQTMSFDFRYAPHLRLSDMVLRTEYNSRCPKLDCHPLETFKDVMEQRGLRMVIQHVFWLGHSSAATVANVNKAWVRAH